MIEGISAILTPQVGIPAVILFILGYIIGSGIKASLKLGGIFILFLAFLVVVGFLPNDVLERIIVVIKTLQPLAEEAQVVLGIKQAANIGLYAFMGGFFLGLLRG